MVFNSNITFQGSNFKFMIDWLVFRYDPNLCQCAYTLYIFILIIDLILFTNLVEYSSLHTEDEMLFYSLAFSRGINKDVYLHK